MEYAQSLTAAKGKENWFALKVIKIFYETVAIKYTFIDKIKLQACW